MQFRSGFHLGLVVLSAACAGLMASSQTTAQEDREAEQRTTGTVEESVTIPSEGLLRLSIIAPEQVRVGDSFQYEIRVTNVTENIVLYNVKLAQEAGQNLDVESSQVQGRENQGQRNRGQQARNQGQTRQGQQQQGQQQQGQQQQGKQQQGQQQGQQQAQQQQQRGQQGRGQQNQGQAQQGRNRQGQQANAGQWTIQKLNPGETQTIQVTAASDQEGQVASCLRVVSYTPALCLATQFVKPELELVKQAPDRVNLCDPFELEYFVKNAGTAPIQQLTISDPLPEGLVLTSGKDKLEFQIDGLEPGQVRKFAAEVIATKPGEFSSRAVAMREGNKTRSQKTTTKVIAPELAIDIEGPQSTYVNRPMQYTIRVTNTGNAAAEETELALWYPGDLTLVDAGEPQQTQRRVNVAYRGGDQPTPAEQEQADRPQQQQQQQQQGQQQNRDARSWELGTLNPGETQRVTVTLRGDQAGTFEQRAVAAFLCGDQEQQEVRTRAVASVSTEVISVPALLLGVSDQSDPVRVGNEVVYTISAGNEGTSPDRNVQVKVQMPEQLQFIEASGPTKAQAQGGTVTFQPIQELQPGEVAKWELRAKATGAGAARLKVVLTSEKMGKEATAEEPTRLFETSPSEQQQPQRRRQQQQRRQQQGGQQQDQ